MTAAGGGGQQGPLVFLIAGEPSGDQLGAGLMAALKSETGRLMTATTDEPSATANELFIKNMAALWSVDPELALLIDQVPDDARLPVEATRSGDWTTAMAAPDGRKAYLHSRY